MCYGPEFVALSWTIESLRLGDLLQAMRCARIALFESYKSNLHNREVVETAQKLAAIFAKHGNTIVADELTAEAAKLPARLDTLSAAFTATSESLRQGNLEQAQQHARTALFVSEAIWGCSKGLVDTLQKLAKVFAEHGEKDESDKFTSEASILARCLSKV